MKLKLCITETMPYKSFRKFILKVDWLVGLFDSVSTLFVSFNLELSHFDESFKHFSLVYV